MGVVQAAGKGKGDFKERVGVGDDVAEGVVCDLFYHITDGIGNNSQGANLVVGQVVSCSGGGHGHGHAAIGVLEPHEEVVGTVVHGQKMGQALPKVFFGEDSIDLLPSRGWRFPTISDCLERS